MLKKFVKVVSDWHINNFVILESDQFKTENTSGEKFICPGHAQAFYLNHVKLGIASNPEMT